MPFSGLKQSSRVIHEEHFNVPVRGPKLLQLRDHMPMHKQVLIRIALVKVVLLGNAAIRLLVMNVQTDAVMGRAQSFAITHVH